MPASAAKLLVSALSLSALAGVAQAADLAAAPVGPPAAPVYHKAPPPLFDWSGIYIGVNGGYGSAGASTTDTITGNTYGANGRYPNSGNLDGYVVGGTIGANYQTGRLVLGIEGDWDWTNQSLTKSVSCTGSCIATGHSKIRWLATLRGRVGYAVNRVLFYGTGGAAFLNAEDTQTQTVPVGAPPVRFSDTAVGWTAGAGVEYAITQNLSAKLEYLYVSANLSDTVAFPAVMGGGVESESVTLSDNLVRAGLNWKF